MSLARRVATRTGPLAQAGMVSSWGASSQIRSVQRGTIAITGGTSNTATIAAVDMNNSRLRFVGSSSSNTGAANTAPMRLAFTNATTITATVGASTGGDTSTVSYEVTEYQPGVIKSTQRGTIAGGGTATITEVNASKSVVDWLGYSETAASISFLFSTRLTLTNGTTVTAATGSASSQVTSYQVVESF